MTSRGAEGCLSQGQRLLRQGRWDEAERALEQAVEQAPEYVWPRLYLALARADGGRAGEARPEIDRALELSPLSAVLRVFRARVLCDAGCYEEAIAACEEALALDPRYTVAAGYWALALLGEGRVAEAAGRWKQAPEEPPSALMGRMLLEAERLAGRNPLPAEEPIELPEAAGKPMSRRRNRAAAAALKRARHAYGKERLAEAQQGYLAVVRAETGWAEAWLELAVVSHELESYETARQALERYRQTAGVDETDPHYRAYMAGCEVKLGSPEAALALLAGADAKQPVVAHTRGLAMLCLDRIPEARFAFIQFSSMMPRFVRNRLKAVLQGDERPTTNDQRPTTDDRPQLYKDAQDE